MSARSSGGPDEADSRAFRELAAAHAEFLDVLDRAVTYARDIAPIRPSHARAIAVAIRGVLTDGAGQIRAILRNTPPP